MKKNITIMAAILAVLVLFASCAPAPDVNDVKPEEEIRYGTFHGHKYPVVEKDPDCPDIKKSFYVEGDYGAYLFRVVQGDVEIFLGTYGESGAEDDWYILYYLNPSNKIHVDEYKVAYADGDITKEEYEIYKNLEPFEAYKLAIERPINVRGYVTEDGYEYTIDNRKVKTNPPCLLEIKGGYNMLKDAEFDATYFAGSAALELVNPESYRGSSTSSRTKNAQYRFSHKFYYDNAMTSESNRHELVLVENNGKYDKEPEVLSGIVGFDLGRILDDSNKSIIRIKELPMNKENRNKIFGII